MPLRIAFMLAVGLAIVGWMAYKVRSENENRRLTARGNGVLQASERSAKSTKMSPPVVKPAATSTTAAKAGLQRSLKQQCTTAPTPEQQDTLLTTLLKIRASQATLAALASETDHQEQARGLSADLAQDSLAFKKLCGLAPSELKETPRK